MMIGFLKRFAVLAVLAVALVSPNSGRAEDAPQTAQPDPAVSIADIVTAGDKAVQAYDPARKMIAADAFSDLYFDKFEPLENGLGARDPDLKSRAESRFTQLIGKAGKGEKPEVVAAAWTDLKTELLLVPAAMGAGQNASGFWEVLLQSFLILVREGFEAMLVVTALAAYLRRAGQTDKVKVVYMGVGWALLASLVMAWIITAIIPVSGAGREAMEGGTMLLAAVVLFYCSYWLFAKREAARWQRYVQQQIDQALSGGKLFALGFAAFLAVFREGAETVLFYQALAGSAQGQMPALAAGLGLAVIALAALFVSMRVLSVRLPLGLFFSATALLLYYLALTFAGKGVVELQNGKTLPITPLSGWPHIDWLGVFPTVEGVVAQAVLVVPMLVAVTVWTLRRRALAAAKVEA